MRPLAAVGVVLCLLGWLGMACQAPSPTLTSAPPPTTTLTPAHTQSPTSTPGPLTDAEAIALVKEEVAARGVAPASFLSRGPVFDSLARGLEVRRARLSLLPARCRPCHRHRAICGRAAGMVGQADSRRFGSGHCRRAGAGPARELLGYCRGGPRTSRRPSAHRPFPSSRER